MAHVFLIYLTHYWGYYVIKVKVVCQTSDSLPTLFESSVMSSTNILETGFDGKSKKLSYYNLISLIHWINNQYDDIITKNLYKFDKKLINIKLHCKY